MAARFIRRCVEMTGEKAEKRVVKKAGKERIKHAVLEKLRRNYLVEIETATQEQLFRAVSDAVMDIIAENWLDTREAAGKQDCRTVY
jgi:starch phosphorylase